MSELTPEKPPWRKWAVVMLICLVALGLRVTGNQWGLVSAENIREAGYPVPSDQVDEERVFTYFWDELSFTSFLSAIRAVGESASAFRQGKLSALEAIGQMFRHAYATGDMGVVPVAPAIYGFWGVGVTAVKAVSGQGTMGWRDVLNNVYRGGRLLTALFSLLLFVPLFVFVRAHLLPGRSTWWRVYAIALAAGCYVLVYHGHFMTYNPLVTLFELTGLLGILRLCERIERASRRALVWNVASLGLLMGVALATKLTTMLIPVMLALGLTVERVRRRGGREALRGILASRELSCFVGACVVALCVYLLLILPALLFSEHTRAAIWMQQRMLLKTDDLAQSNITVTVPYYFGATLPAAMGWGLYLTGWCGLMLLVSRWRTLTLGPFLMVAWLGVSLLVYSTSPLGMLLMRASLVSIFFLCCSVYFTASVFARGRWGKSVAITLASYLLIAGFTRSVVFDAQLLSDQPGYRTDLTRQVLREVEPGATIFTMAGRIVSVDLTVIERAGDGDTNMFGSDNVYRYETIPRDYYVTNLPDYDVPMPEDIETSADYLLLPAPAVTGGDTWVPQAHWLPRHQRAPAWERVALTLSGNVSLGIDWDWVARPFTLYRRRGAPEE